LYSVIKLRIYEEKKSQNHTEDTHLTFQYAVTYSVTLPEVTFDDEIMQCKQNK